MKKKVEKRTKETQIKMCTSLSFYCGKANNQSTRRPHKSWDLFLSPEMGGKIPPTHSFLPARQVWRRRKPVSAKSLTHRDNLSGQICP